MLELEPLRLTLLSLEHLGDDILTLPGQQGQAGGPNVEGEQPVVLRGEADGVGRGQGADAHALQPGADRQNDGLAELLQYALHQGLGGENQLLLNSPEGVPAQIDKVNPQADLAAGIAPSKIFGLQGLDQPVDGALRQIEPVGQLIHRHAMIRLTQQGQNIQGLCQSLQLCHWEGLLCASVLRQADHQNLPAAGHNIIVREKGFSCKRC